MDPKRKFNINLSLICFMIVGCNFYIKRYVYESYVAEYLTTKKETLK